MRTSRRIASTLLAVALAAVLSACGGAPQSALDPAGPFAERPDDLFQLVFWIAVVVFVLVQGLIIYAVVKFRQKPGDTALPVQTHGNTKLEIFWTVIPAVILAGIAVPTVRMVFDLDAEPDNALQVDVIGHRWWFEYRYPAQPEFGIDEEFATANEMIIPAATPVRLRMTSEESGSAEGAVIHSFWVPSLAGKQDLVPGKTTTMNIEANEPGRYLGQCAEYCGLSHANMRARVVALEDAGFDDWVALQQSPADDPEPGTLAAEGKALLFETKAGGNACVSCHAIRGAEQEVDGQLLQAAGQVGPDLTHLMSRREFAGAIFDLYERGPDGEFLLDQPNEDLLAQWLAQPVEMKPMQPEAGWGMPNLGLTDEEVEAITAYLITLD